MPFFDKLLFINCLSLFIFLFCLVIYYFCSLISWTIPRSSPLGSSAFSLGNYRLASYNISAYLCFLWGNHCLYLTNTVINWLSNWVRFLYVLLLFYYKWCKSSNQFIERIVIYLAVSVFVLGGQWLYNIVLVLATYMNQLSMHMSLKASWAFSLPPSPNL